MAAYAAVPPDNIFDILFQEIENEKAAVHDENTISAGNPSTIESSKKNGILSALENNKGTSDVEVQQNRNKTNKETWEESLEESNINENVTSPVNSMKESWIEPLETIVGQSPSLINLSEKSDDDDSTEVVTLYEDPSISKMNLDLNENVGNNHQQDIKKSPPSKDLSQKSGINFEDFLTHLDEPSLSQTDADCISNTSKTSTNNIASQYLKSETLIFNSPSTSIETSPAIENDLFTFTKNDTNDKRNNEQIVADSSVTEVSNKKNFSINSTSIEAMNRKSQQSYHTNIVSTSQNSKVKGNYADDFLQLSLSGSVTEIKIDEPVSQNHQTNISEIENFASEEKSQDLRENNLIKTTNPINNSFPDASNNINDSKSVFDLSTQQSGIESSMNISQSVEVPEFKASWHTVPIEEDEPGLKILKNDPEVFRKSPIIDNDFDDNFTEKYSHDVNESNTNVPVWSYFGQKSSENNNLPKTETYSSHHSPKNSYDEIETEHYEDEEDKSEMKQINNFAKRREKKQNRPNWPLLLFLLVCTLSGLIFGVFYVLPQVRSSLSPHSDTGISSGIPTQHPSLTTKTKPRSYSPTRGSQAASAIPSSPPATTNQPNKPPLPKYVTQETSIPSGIPSYTGTVSMLNSSNPVWNPSTQPTFTRPSLRSKQPSPYYNNYNFKTSRNPSIQPTSTLPYLRSNHPSQHSYFQYDYLKPSGYPSIQPSSGYDFYYHSPNLSSYPSTQPTIIDLSIQPSRGYDFYYHSPNPSRHPSTQPTIIYSSLTSNQPSIIPHLTKRNRTGYSLIGETYGFLRNQESISLSLSEDGRRLIVGTYQLDLVGDEYRRVGTIRIFEFISDHENAQTFWVLIGEMGGAFLRSHYGYSVTISGDGSSIAFSNISNNTFDAGEVLVYRNEESGNWTNIGNISGELNGDSFGSSLSLSFSGQYLAVGAPTYKSVGRAYLYNNSYGSQWTLVGDEIITGNKNNSLFGWSVSLSHDGMQLLIGAPQSYGTNRPGFAVVYEMNRTFNKLSEIGFFASDMDSFDFDRFGHSIAQSSDGSFVLIGSPNYDGKGLAQLYKKEIDSGKWSLMNEIKGSKHGDLLGFAVDLSSTGDVIAITAGGKAKIANTHYMKQNDVIAIEANLTNKFDRSISISGNGTILALGDSSSDSSKIFELFWPDHS